jgi:hypothetical protein
MNFWQFGTNTTLFSAANNSQACASEIYDKRVHSINETNSAKILRFGEFIQTNILV